VNSLVEGGWWKAALELELGHAFGTRASACDRSSIDLDERHHSMDPSLP